MKKLFSILTAFVVPLQAFAASDIHVTGKVTEAGTNEPLIGVSVMITGTTSGTVTDFDGNYEINVPADGSLLFSYIGFVDVTVPVNGQGVINCELGVDNKLLDEVVVVGYTVQKKRDVLGAVSKVNGSELVKVPVSSVEQSLQGRVAGVDITTQTGAPGAGLSVRVRGTNSISSNNEPLYIVDGIPVESAFNTLSPNDIENITILKDASSAAIYGSRAANGVVVITTKRGAKGDAKVSYNMQAGVQFHGHLTEMVNTQEYIQIYNESVANDNLVLTIPRAAIAGDWIKDFANENHLENIFRVAPIHQHEISVNGGNDKTQYLISGSYFGQDGIIRGTDYNRASIRSNVNSQVKDWLKVGLNLNGTYGKQRMVSSSGDGYVSEGGSVVRYALFRTPAIPTYDKNGKFVDLPSTFYGDPKYDEFFGDGYSPEGLIANTDRTSETYTFLGSGDIQINFARNIFLKATAGVDYRDYTLRVFNPTWGDHDRINSTNGLDINNNKHLNWTANATFNHLIETGKHTVNYMVGAEFIKNHDKSYGMSDTKFSDTDEKVLYVGLGNGINRATQGESGSALMSFFANVNYNYAGKYYVSGILREDGSSRFSKGNRWGTFYSVSAGWNMEQEPWLQDAENLNKLKLRAGYGSIGNQNIALYAYSDRYSRGYYYALGNNQAVNGYAQTTLGNDKLKWETSNQVNVGVDVELLDNTLGFTVDYYYKVTKDMLVQESLPLSVGNMGAPWVNNGSVMNTGVDFEIFYRRNFKDWGFNINLNGGYLYNRVLSLNSPIQGGRVDSGVYATMTQVGHPIGSFYLYKMEGIFQDELDIMTSANQGKPGTIFPGDVKYADVNGDNVIDEKDRTFVGSAMPKFTTGLNLGFNFKGFDASLFFQGAFGQKIYSQVNYDIEGFYRGFTVTKRYFNEHWTPENHSNTQPRAASTGKSNNVKASTRFLEDGSYLRLKNVQLGYTFKFKEDAKISNLRIYAAASNLFTITGYNGLDPEMTSSTNASGEGDRANGIDWGTYPVAKSVTLGLNFTF